MLTCIPNLLSHAEVARLRAIAAEAPFVAGTATAGRRLEQAKSNLQLAPDAPAREEVDRIVLGALQRNALFQSAALPKMIHPPTLSLYRDGMTYGSHVDAAIMGRMRADISLTLFLNDPASYDGGELTIETGAGAQAVKLPAGEAVVYPTSAFHWVSPVTRGERLAAVTWAQSAVRGAEQRAVLFDLRRAIERLSETAQDAEPIQMLVKTHANLLRLWADV